LSTTENEIGAWRKILGKTTDPEILKALAPKVCDVPFENQMEGLHALLGKTSDPVVLIKLVGNVRKRGFRAIKFENRAEFLRAILGKTTDSTVLKSVENHLFMVPHKN